MIESLSASSADRLLPPPAVVAPTRSRRQWLSACLLGFALVIGGAVSNYAWLQHQVRASIPPVPAIDVYAALVDTTPITVTITLPPNASNETRPSTTYAQSDALAQHASRRLEQRAGAAAAPRPGQHVRTTSTHSHESPSVGCDARARLGPCASADAHGGVPTDGCVLGWLLRCRRSVRASASPCRRYACGDRHVRVVVRSSRILRQSGREPRYRACWSVRLRPRTSAATPQAWPRRRAVWRMSTTTIRGWRHVSSPSG